MQTAKRKGNLNRQNVKKIPLLTTFMQASGIYPTAMFRINARWQRKKTFVIY